jgi:hypothetical protein
MWKPAEADVTNSLSFSAWAAPPDGPGIATFQGCAVKQDRLNLRTEDRLILTFLTLLSSNILSSGSPFILLGSAPSKLATTLQPDPWKDFIKKKSNEKICNKNTICNICSLTNVNEKQS